MFCLFILCCFVVLCIPTRSSAIAERPCDAKACQGLLKWTWKWQPRLKWPSKYFKVIKSCTNRKLVYDFLLVVYCNLCRITHRFWEVWCETVQWPWNMPKVIDSCITWNLLCGHVCKMLGRQWTKEAKIAIFNYPTLIWRPLSTLQRTPTNICINLIPPETMFPGLHFCPWQYMGSSASFRTVLSESRRLQPISCRVRNRF